MSAARGRVGEIGTGIYPTEILDDVYDVIMERVLLEERLNYPRDATLFLDTLVDLGHVMVKGEHPGHDQDALNAVVGAMCRAATFDGWFGDDDTEDCIGSIRKRGYCILPLSVHEARTARYDLAAARAALAAAVRAQDPDRHFRGLPESPEVIAAYDAVRAAEGEVARLEREGRR